MSNLNTDLAVRHIKILVDENRCNSCDLLSGPIVRYSCGHTSCKSCSEIAEDCLLCLSPPTVSSTTLDASFSQRVKNASELLNSFQDLFKLDVYKHHRLSEQLKLEKQLFPKCIQAPTKYCNKRKSSIGIKDKENSQKSFIAGENICNVSKMDNTINYVQQWLKSNETNSKKSNHKLPRKPFADLNVNEQSCTKDNIVTKANNKESSYRKRKNIKAVNTNSDKKQRLLPKKKQTNSFRELRSRKDDTKFNFNSNSYENDESGIVVDEETIVTDNSPAECKDKDQLALIAIEEAEESTCTDFISFDVSNNEDFEKNDISKPDIESKLYKVKFYKKSLLHKNCNECKVDKNLSVIIDGNEYVTTIKVSHCPVTKVKVVNNQSVQIQTEPHIREPNKIYTHYMETDEVNTPIEINNEVPRSSPKVLPIHEEDTEKVNESVDAEISKVDNDVINLDTSQDVSKFLPQETNKCVVIEESDTDSDINEIEGTLEVTAEVHREETYNDFGVLSAIEPNEYETRMKRNTLRGHTPLSTDSSDKENYDPNRMKKQKLCKKNCNKK